MLEKIQQTQTFQNLDSFKRKIYSSKKELDQIKHLLEVAKNTSFENMVKTQNPNYIETNIIKELLE